VDEDVASTIRVLDNEVGGARLKRYELAVGREGREDRCKVPLRSAGTDRNAAGLARIPIVDEDVGSIPNLVLAVRVTDNKVSSVGIECNYVAIGRKGGIV